MAAWHSDPVDPDHRAIGTLNTWRSTQDHRQGGYTLRGGWVIPIRPVFFARMDDAETDASIGKQSVRGEVRVIRLDASETETRSAVCS
jgi:hypothetical protein